MSNPEQINNLKFSRVEIVKVGDASIACHRHGTGKKVLCLHATGHSSRDFVELAHSLGDRLEFIAVDWPGQGDSTLGNSCADAEHYASILGGVLDALELEDCVILGNSIGGAAAIIHSSRRPAGVSGLVLCNPGGLQAVNLIARLYCRFIARKFAKGEAEHPKFEHWFRRYYEKTVLPEQPATWRRNEIIATGYQVAPILRSAWEGFAQPVADLRPLVKNLSMPVLYAWARADQAVAWSRSKKAALQAPINEVKMFQAGHCAFLECPDEFRREFCRFLDGLN